MDAKMIGTKKKKWNEWSAEICKEMGIERVFRLLTTSNNNKNQTKPYHSMFDYTAHRHTDIINARIKETFFIAAAK